MKEYIFALGAFVDRQFDKLLLYGLIFATVYQAQNSPELEKEIAIGAFSALLGFMQGRKVGSANAK